MKFGRVGSPDAVPRRVSDETRRRRDERGIDADAPGKTGRLRTGRGQRAGDRLSAVENIGSCALPPVSDVAVVVADSELTALPLPRLTTCNTVPEDWKIADWCRARH